MTAKISYVHPVSGAVRPLTLELLRSIYLVPRQGVPFNLREALMGEGEAPWSASLAVAATETITAVERSLREVMLATRTLRPTEIDPSLLPAGSRARRHLEALLSLWCSLEDALPEDLWIMRHVLEASAADAIEPLQILVENGQKLAPAEQALVERLLEHHGPAEEAICSEHAEAGLGRRTRANDTSLLGHIQRDMLNERVGKWPLDESVTAFGVRDAAMETDVAAGIAQSLLDRNSSLAPCDIGLLLPGSQAYTMFVAEAFSRAGLPLSGLPALPDRNDIAGETLQHFLLARRIPAPAMALASLLASSLMPWSGEIGQQMANDIMRGNFRPAGAASLSGKALELYKTIRRDTASGPKALADELATFRNVITDHPDIQPFVERARDLCSQLRALLLSRLDAAEPPWEELLRIAAPLPPAASVSAARTAGGITVFTEGELPWREVSHLIVLGYAEGSHPSRVPGNPLFLDSEIRSINERCGLAMRTQAEAMSERLDLFRSQIGIASQNVTFLVPHRDLAGKRLAPASSLPLVARCIEALEEPEDLIVDLDTLDEEDWPDMVPRALETKGFVWTPPTPSAPQILLGRDLLKLRAKEDGTDREQSPSRLETMIVSPLAWLLSELKATEEVWAPEAVDVLLKGNLAHEVFEQLFLPGAPLPTPEEIREQVPRLLIDRIRQSAPFMQASAWALERRTLEGEILRAAMNWRNALATSGAVIVRNEFLLRGSIFDVEVHGRADCLLRFEDGQLIIVDHKKSGTRNRQGRLQAGWDLQVELYRRMARTNSVGGDDTDEVLQLLAAANSVGVAYHLMNDGGILVHGAMPENFPSAFTVLDGDISGAALSRLQDGIERLRRGEVALNRDGDRKFFKDEARMGLYAFEVSPLVDAFTFVSLQEEGSETDE